MEITVILRRDNELGGLWGSARAKTDWSRYSWDELAKSAKPAQSSLIGEFKYPTNARAWIGTVIVAGLRQIFPFLFMMLDFFYFIRRFLETLKAGKSQLR